MKYLKIFLKIKDKKTATFLLRSFAVRSKSVSRETLAQVVYCDAFKPEHDK